LGLFSIPYNNIKNPSKVTITPTTVNACPGNSTPEFGKIIRVGLGNIFVGTAVAVGWLVGTGVEVG